MIADNQIGIKNELMEFREKYFDLCYTRRIHEFYKIDLYKNWPSGTAKMKFSTLTEFYLAELQIGKINSTSSKLILKSIMNCIQIHPII